MRIITTADDFGYCDDTVTETIACLEAGSLTSATLMANMPATTRAAAYAAANPHHSFGAHLTFVADTVEAPVAPVEAVPALVGEDGRFLPSNRVRVMGLRNAIPVDQIAVEIEAQLGRLRDLGVQLTHVDSHGHLHKFRPFREALAIALPRFGITKVRNAQNIYLKAPWRSPTYWLGPTWRKALMRDFTTTPNFFMDTSSDDWPERLLAHLPDDGDLEVGVHPGTMEDWRVGDRDKIGRFADAARREGHAIIGWREL